MNNKGFTLVPMIIILVILGLAVSSVIKFKASQFAIINQEKYDDIDDYLSRTIDDFIVRQKKLPTTVKVNNELYLSTNGLAFPADPILDKSMIIESNSIRNAQFVGSTVDDATRLCFTSDTKIQINYKCNDKKCNNINSAYYVLISPGDNGVYETTITDDKSGKYTITIDTSLSDDHITFKGLAEVRQMINCNNYSIAPIFMLSTLPKISQNSTKDEAGYVRIPIPIDVTPKDKNSVNVSCYIEAIGLPLLTTIKSNCGLNTAEKNYNTIMPGNLGLFQPYLDISTSALDFTKITQTSYPIVLRVKIKYLDRDSEGSREYEINFIKPKI